MEPYLQTSNRSIRLAVAIGILTGIALIVTEGFTTKGPAVFLPYAALLVASFFVLRKESQPAFSHRFTAVFLAFAVATAVFYAAMGIVDPDARLGDISFVGHLWRLGLMTGIGGLASAAVAFAAGAGLSNRELLH